MSNPIPMGHKGQHLALSLVQQDEKLTFGIGKDRNVVVRWGFDRSLIQQTFEPYMYPPFPIDVVDVAYIPRPSILLRNENGFALFALLENGTIFQNVNLEEFRIFAPTAHLNVKQIDGDNSFLIILTDENELYSLGNGPVGHPSFSVSSPFKIDISNLNGEIIEEIDASDFFCTARTKNNLYVWSTEAGNHILYPNHTSNENFWKPTAFFFPNAKSIVSYHSQTTSDLFSVFILTKDGKSFARGFNQPGNLCTQSKSFLNDYIQIELDFFQTNLPVDMAHVFGNQLQLIDENGIGWRYFETGELDKTPFQDHQLIKIYPGFLYDQNFDTLIVIAKKDGKEKFYFQNNLDVFLEVSRTTDFSNVHNVKTVLRVQERITWFLLCNEQKIKAFDDLSHSEQTKIRFVDLENVVGMAATENLGYAVTQTDENLEVYSVQLNSLETMKHDSIGNSKLAQFQGGRHHFLLLTQDGKLFGFGSSKHYELSRNQTFSETLVSIDVPTKKDERIVNMNIVYHGNLVLTNLGRIFVWGLFFHIDKSVVPDDTLVQTSLLLQDVDPWNIHADFQGYYVVEPAMIQGIPTTFVPDSLTSSIIESVLLSGIRCLGGEGMMYQKDDWKSCSNRGHCITNNTCHCFDGYGGTGCEFSVLQRCSTMFPDDPLVCSQHGQCIDGKCHCNNGYTGELCDKVSKNLQLLWPILGIVGLISSIVVISVCVLVFFIVCGISRMQKTANKKRLSLLQNRYDQYELIDHDQNQAKIKLHNSMFEIDFNEIKIEEKIGSGGSNATVFKGFWKGSNVAVKVFTQSTLAGEDAFEEFENEMNLMISIRHRNVVSCFGACIKFPRLGIVMEYCPYSISELITNGELQKYTVKEKLDILIGICEGMIFLHYRGIVHRDLKCDNLLMGEDGCVKVCDFGLAKFTQDQKSLPLQTAGVGTSYYIPPEILNNKRYDASCDMFSFGIMCYEILTNKLNPFEGLTPMQVQYRTANDPNFRPNLNALKKTPFESLMWILKSTWHHDQKERPTFSQVKGFLVSLLNINMQFAKSP